MVYSLTLTLSPHFTLRVVKEEIADDDMSLPNVNGRVICWVSASLPLSPSLSLSLSPLSPLPLSLPWPSFYHSLSISFPRPVLPPSLSSLLPSFSSLPYSLPLPLSFLAFLLSHSSLSVCVCVCVVGGNR